MNFSAGIIVLVHETHTMLSHAVRVCFGPKMYLHSPFNFFALRTFF